MRSPISIVLAITASCASVHALESQDILAVSRFAEGGGSDATPVAADQHVRAGDRPAVLALTDAPGSTVILAPGAEVHLVRSEHADGRSLMIALDAGAIQVSIPDKGFYHDLHVVGGAIDARVTGTLFVVERVKRDTDYVALIHGKLSVTLRQEVAEVVAAGASDHVELDSHEAVEGGIAGLGPVASLKARPQLAVTTGPKKMFDDAPADGGWDIDDAAAAIAAALAASGSDGAADISGVIADAIYDDIAGAIIGGIEHQITLDVLHATLAPPAELGGPPRPPGP